MVAAIFNRFDLDSDKFLKHEELCALEYEVDNEAEISGTVFRQVILHIQLDVHMQMYHHFTIDYCDRNVLHRCHVPALLCGRR
jgi:hypothetical protein